MLKLRRKKKGEEDQKNQLEQTKAQGDAQAKASEAQAKAQKDASQEQVKGQIQLEEIKTTGKTQVLQAEAALKKELMQMQFQFDMQLKQLEAKTKNAGQLMQENRKDDRTKIQATQQSSMIDQKENQKPAKNFESSSDDILGGFNL